MNKNEGTESLRITFFHFKRAKVGYLQDQSAIIAFVCHPRGHVKRVGKMCSYGSTHIRKSEGNLMRKRTVLAAKSLTWNKDDQDLP